MSKEILGVIPQCSGQNPGVCSRVHSFIHSLVYFTTVPYSLPKRVLHRVWSDASSFNFHYPLVSLRSSFSCLCLFLCLPITSLLSCIIPSITCFRRQFLHKMWPILLAFLHFIACRIYLSSLTLCNTSLFLTQLVQLIFSIFTTTTFQNFPGIPHLLSKVAKFQHHTKLCTKCSIVLPSLNLSSVCWWKESSCWMVLFARAILVLISRVDFASFLLCYSNGWNIPCSLLFLIHHNLYWGWLPWDYHYLSFLYFYFHSIASSNFC